MVTKEQFKDFKQEVEDLGVSAMQYRQRKNVEAQKFARLGLKPEKVRPSSLLGFTVQSVQVELTRQGILFYTTMFEGQMCLYFHMSKSGLAL